jgi:hypothetical protein
LKFYFKCPRSLHKSEKFCISKITSRNPPQDKCRACNSFAQWGIDNICSDFLEKYWDYEKNTVDPWEISYGTKNNVWLKCQEKNYHGSYLIRCSIFVHGSRCNLCKSSKTLYFLDSFAQFHIDHTDPDFLEKYWDWDKNNEFGINPWEIRPHSNKFIWIKCQEKDYHGNYKTTPNIFTSGCRCPYCNTFASKKVHYFDSIGYKYPESIDIWSDKNEKTPYDYSIYSDSLIFWRCLDGIHNDYLRTISNARAYNFRCPDCVRERDESFLQETVRLYLENNYLHQINHESKCCLIPINPRTNHTLPFDNEIEKLHLIIEVNGEQHYKETAYFHSINRRHLSIRESLEDQKERDRIKREYAISKGYRYLEIPYYSIDDGSYQNLILDAIEQAEKEMAG